MKKDNILKSKKFKIVTILLALAVILALLAVIVLNTGLKYKVKKVLNEIYPEKFLYSEYYQNNVKYDDIKDVNFYENDVREVQVGEDVKYLVNHSRGFALGFPKDAEFDFSAAQEYIKVKCNNMSCVVSKEYSTYATASETKKFVDDYLHKYMLDERYMEQNKITLHKNAVEKIGDYWVQVVALSRTPVPKSPVKYNTYAYCYIYTDSTMFYRLMFKTADYTDEFMNEVYKTLYSFSENVPVVGVSDTFTDFKPQIPDFWSQETKEFYNSLVNSKACKWGLYTPHAVVNNDFTSIHEIEEKIDAKFEGLLEYRYYFEDMPVDGIKKAYDEGKVVELTMQTSTVMNEELDGYNPVFDILDGLYDERLNKMAKQIKEIGHPIFFRLNNEMNSDWTSYGGSACLDDPEIYVELWRKIYDIFKANGVDNAIWVFNPNDESYPPCGYNASMAYYPGDEYVQVFGVTGYNTGTYYAEENGEKWRTFEEIYDNVMAKNERIYGKFPWIITEFASSSIGGDKVLWIEDMFEKLNKYPNIKMAFWFNSVDMDIRLGKPGIVARPYKLDETEETTKAFSKGIKKAQEINNK